MRIHQDKDLMKIAEKRVRAKKEFLVHLAVYMIVNGFLSMFFIAIAIFTGASATLLPPILSIFGWGIGLAIHGFVAFTTIAQRPTPQEVAREYARMMGDNVVIDCRDEQEDARFAVDAPRHN